MSGVGTVLHDDAALTVRAPELGLDKDLSEEIVKEQPLRVVLDRKARLPVESRLLREESPVLWCVSDTTVFNSEAEKISQLPHVDVFRLSIACEKSVGGEEDKEHEKSELQQVLIKLSELQCNEVLLEAGAALAGSVISESLWDELVIYMAPKLLGSRARALADLPLDAMSQAKDLKMTDVRQVGNDLRVTYIPN